MELAEKVLEAMKKAGVPLNAGKLVELTGLDRKEVDKAMKTLKANDAIVSPKNCFWQPKYQKSILIEKSFCNAGRLFLCLTE